MKEISPCVVDFLPPPLIEETSIEPLNTIGIARRKSNAK
jgi:hypothetical protein